MSEKIDTDKDAPKITQEESFDIALKYLKHFGFDPNLGTYKLEKQDLKTINEGTSYEHKVYTYRFVKYIDDIVTTDS